MSALPAADWYTGLTTISTATVEMVVPMVLTRAFDCSASLRRYTTMTHSSKLAITTRQLNTAATITTPFADFLVEASVAPPASIKDVDVGLRLVVLVAVTLVDILTVSVLVVEASAVVVAGIVLVMDDVVVVGFVVEDIVVVEDTESVVEDTGFVVEDDIVAEELEIVVVDVGFFVRDAESVVGDEIVAEEVKSQVGDVRVVVEDTESVVEDDTVAEELELVAEDVEVVAVDVTADVVVLVKVVVVVMAGVVMIVVVTAVVLRGVVAVVVRLSQKMSVGLVINVPSEQRQVVNDKDVEEQWRMSPNMSLPKKNK